MTRKQIAKFCFLVFWIAFSVFVILIGISSAGVFPLPTYTPTPTLPECLSVEEVYQNLDRLKGQTVCVYGYPQTMISQTLVLCCPNTCDCNRTWTTLSLYPSPTEGYSRQKSIDIPLECYEDGCSRACGPIDPGDYQVEMYRFYGRLSGASNQPVFENIDYSKSRGKYNGEWMPIPTGYFTKIYITATLVPGACEPRPSKTPTPYRTPTP